MTAVSHKILELLFNIPNPHLAIKNEIITATIMSTTGYPNFTATNANMTEAEVKISLGLYDRSIFTLDDLAQQLILVPLM